MGQKALQARGRLVGGDAFHLAVVAQVCSRLRPGQVSRSCDRCPSAGPCGAEVDAVIAYAAGLRPGQGK